MMAIRFVGCATQRMQPSLFPFKIRTPPALSVDGAGGLQTALAKAQLRAMASRGDARAAAMLREFEAEA
jgi:hypothetical protein